MAFIPSSCLIALAGTFSTMLNRSSKRRNLWPVLDYYEENLPFITIKYDVNCVV